MKKLLIFVITLVFILSVYGCAAPKKIEATDFTLTSIDGKLVKFSKLRGKIVMLNFWATWCPPCRQEMPSMQKLYTKMKNENFQMITVNVEQTSKDKIIEFMAKNKYTFPVLTDPMNFVSSRYGIVSIPTTFIIDKSGYIVKKIVGAYEWNDGSVVAELIKLSRAKK